MAETPIEKQYCDETNEVCELRRPVPVVSLPAEHLEEHTTNFMHKSDSKLSLPSSLGTPTSPLMGSSPMSLPSSPTPFLSISPVPPPPSSPKTSPSVTQGRVTLGQPEVKDSLTALVNSGSATGNPRNKCALQPGHSLMDWIRLGNSSRDLTGVGGRIQPVTRSQLATHNTKKDAWLAIRGRVYNVTHYLAFHPGGQEELLRGVGIDATQLFDKVHAWVNFDSLLAKCLVGPLTADLPTHDQVFGSNPSIKSDRLKEPSRAQELVRKSMENLANCITPVKQKISLKTDENTKSANPSKIMQSLIQSSELPLSISRSAGSAVAGECPPPPPQPPPPLRYDWIQTTTKLTISIYTGPLANPAVSAKLKNDSLLIEVVTDDWARTLTLTPEAELKEQLQLRVYAESGKVDVTCEKHYPRVWSDAGNMEAAPARARSVRDVRGRICAREDVTHDVVALRVSCEHAVLAVPLGHHIRVHATVQDEECVRSYTPVGEGWCRGAEPGLSLVVKGYPSGKLSRHLTALAVGDDVTLSGPYGNFQLSCLKPVKRIYLIAAGTGITPMLGLIKFMLARSNPKCEKVTLLFFNKTEKDIILRDKFQDITAADDRLTSTHVLSEADASWPGLRGHITLALITDILHQEVLPSDDQSDQYYVCVCGSNEFSNKCIDFLKELGVRDTNWHAFKG